MVDLLAASAADPYPEYAAVRAVAPVHWNPPGLWMALGYAEVRAVLRDTATFSIRPSRPSPLSGAGPAPAPGGSGPEREAGGADRAVGLFVEPVRHTRLRRLVAQALSPDLAAALAAGVTADVRALVDRLAARLAGGGTVDLVAELADPVPVATLARLVGAPAADGPALLDWARRTDELADLGGMSGGPARLTDPSAGPAGPAGPAGLAGLAGHADPADQADGLRAAAELHDYADRLVARREGPGPGPTGDVVDALLAARAADPGLSRPEVVATVMTLLTAGRSATARLLGSALLTLLRHPDQLDRLVIGAVGAVSAAEELLRYDPPVALQRRVAVRDAELGGRRVSAGQVVLAVLGAANRDPDAFVDPDRLDLGRDPTGHLSFGVGTHQCVGAALARLQLATVLEAVSGRLPQVAPPDDPVWQGTAGTRALTALPVRAARPSAVPPGAVPPRTAPPGAAPPGAAPPGAPPGAGPNGAPRPGLPGGPGGASTAAVRAAPSPSEAPLP